MASLQHLAWDDFRLVKTIAEAGGLAGAAERLGVNHSTVFRRLGQLEEELGVKLFERRRTGYALTPAGRRWRPSPSAWRRMSRPSRENSPDSS